MRFTFIRSVSLFVLLFLSRSSSLGCVVVAVLFIYFAFIDDCSLFSYLADCLRAVIRCSKHTSGVEESGGRRGGARTIYVRYNRKHWYTFQIAIEIENAKRWRHIIMKSRTHTHPQTINLRKMKTHRARWRWHRITKRINNRNSIPSQCVIAVAARKLMAQNITYVKWACQPILMRRLRFSFISFLFSFFFFFVTCSVFGDIVAFIVSSDTHAHALFSSSVSRASRLFAGRKTCTIVR